ncbi:MAG: hypothetical protein Q8Q47_05270 [Ignavibacteriaceae bacterium]|nr:hypothetical protein [Ignavibacteriaceae bacterium]
MIVNGIIVASEMMGNLGVLGVRLVKHPRKPLKIKQKRTFHPFSVVENAKKE